MENNFNLNNGDNENNKPFVIKTIYGIIGGIQSILHILSGLCDLFYLLKEFKIYVLENIFKTIKLSISFLRYLLNFEFIDNKITKLISNIITSFGIALCLILLTIIKKEKEKSLKEQTNDEKTNLRIYFNSID